MQLTRRHFLGLAAAATGAGALALGAAGVTLSTWWDQPVAAGFRHMSADEAAFVRALAAAAFPSTPQVPFDAETAELDHFVDASMDSLAPEIRKALRMLLHGLDAFTLPTHGAHLSALPLAARQDVLMGWLRADNAELRGVGNMLTLILGMGYTTHPTVAPYFRAMHGCAFGREYGA